MSPTTLSGLIESYFAAAKLGRHKADGRPKRASTLDMERDYFERLIKPRLGGMRVTVLNRHDLQSFLDEVHVTTPAGARHCRALVRQAFNFGIRRELVSVRNPAQLVDLPKPASRERVLSDDELRTIWQAARGRAPIHQGGDAKDVPKLSLATGTGLAICLAMVTLQRGGEVVGIHARELDRAARLWTLPGERTKNRRPHVVPLSDLAMELIDQAYTFAALTTGAENGAWQGHAFPSPHRAERAAAPIGRLALSSAVGRLMTAVGIADATAHDFRRTGATNLTGESLNIPRFIVSRVLNQISDTGGAAAVTGVYDRNQYLTEKRRALDAWARLLLEIVSASRSAFPTSLASGASNPPSVRREVRAGAGSFAGAFRK